MRRFSAVDGMLLATVLIWAFNITVTKYVLTHGFRPLAYASVRYGGAAILTAAVVLLLERSIAIHGRRHLALLLLATVSLLCNQLAFVYALKLATATTVALILGTTPIFTALVSLAVGLEQPSPRHWIAALVTFGGVALVALGSGGGLSSNVGGELLAIGLAFTWSVYSVTIAPLMRSYSPYRISALVLVTMGIPLVAISAPQLGAQRWDLSTLVWFCLAFAIVGPLALTNLLWFTAVHRVGPSRATLISNLQPFVAAVFALVILSEHLGLLQVLGGLAILAGILLERQPELVRVE
jgi:drug/metabolite transporter (DMT)-like permease